ncbi:MAG TPA: energy-coupling factor transporter ATPase [Candidatus Binataceae bacterium]|nr:energy-coupling factor transporter ATPase [Candidatus Binataceae bacterium]
MKTAEQTQEQLDPAGASGDSGSAVTLEDVVFTYRSGQHPALDGISLAQRRGEMVGVMGGSGAGKSSLAKCFNAIIPGFEAGTFQGTVRVCGRGIIGSRVCDMAPTVGMVFQDFEAQLFSTNVAHEVAFAMEQVGLPPAEIRARMGPALAAVGLAGFEDRDPTSLSGGEKQRLAIASVLAVQPSIVVLDEPTTDLDPEGRGEVFDLVRQMRDRGLSLLIIEHETEEMRECDRIIVLRDAKVITEGTPEVVLRDTAMLAECGIRPPGLNRVLTQLGIHAHARNIDEAEALIRQWLQLPPQFAGIRAANVSERSATTIADGSVAPVAGQNHQPGTASAGGAPLVEVQGLEHVYGGTVRALDGVDLTINPGEFVAIIGQNGSGKTTLAKHIVGLLKPDRGRVMLAGRERSGIGAAEAAAIVGYVFQNPDHQIFAGTVEDEVAFGPRNFGLPAAEIERRSARVLNAVGLETLRGQDPFLLGRGERQRLAVASVLALEPRLLILDEPTTGLDYPQQRRMMDLISELNRAGTAIVIITHTPWLVAEYAQRAVLMRKGRKLFDGPVRELFDQEELLKSARFRVPEVTGLSRRFGMVALTAEELAAALRGAP